MSLNATETPSLFDQPRAVEEPTGSETGSITPDRYAREFVKWCFSFGPDFRNSPDVVNLRFWAQRVALNLKPADEPAILAEAGRLFGKKIEQVLRNSEAPSELGF